MKVKEILNLLDFRPFEEMVNLFRTTKKERIKVEILIELCNYIAPKLKNVEVSSDTQNPFVINLNLKPNSNKPVLQSLEEKIIETVIDEQNEE